MTLETILIPNSNVNNVTVTVVILTGRRVWLLLFGNNYIPYFFYIFDHAKYSIILYFFPK